MHVLTQSFSDNFSYEKRGSALAAGRNSNLQCIFTNILFVILLLLENIIRKYACFKH